ncbi:MAG TPA: 2-phospho-L-lactate transferase [Polyangiales bacterium]|nr:2-phospho-L-lactate transferase [Polyangiales bacterium]
MSFGPLVYLSGGVGGARLAHGLYHCLPAQQLTCIVNTGDDLVHWGLSVSPDLDTMMYTLADVADVERGWGLSDETFEALAGVKRYGGESWFALGDRDLATHLMRSEWLRLGATLTQVTARLSAALGVSARILPMSDSPRETMIETSSGTLAFQRWLVAERGAPVVERVWFKGEGSASRDVLEALDHARLVVIGPSNPYVSIEPILATPGVRERIARLPVLAVSPIVHGKAVKGPLAGMLQSLSGLPAEAASVARYYGSLLRGYVIEQGDRVELEPPVPVLPTATVMKTRADSRALAQAVLAFAKELRLWS